MKKDFFATDWKKYLPRPVCEEHPEYVEFYYKAWELAHDHVRSIPGMPQNPYMDEGVCDTQIWIWDTCFMSFFCKFAKEVFPGVESFQNFYSVLHEGTLLPTVIPKENEPAWTYATPGVPTNIKVHIPDNPPLFAWGEYENALFHGDTAYLKELLYKKKFLQKHYEWVENLTEKKEFSGVLTPNRMIRKKYGYQWDGCCSGMDNTPRGRTEIPSVPYPKNPDMLWIDAICQQALSAKMIARLFALLNDSESEKYWLAEFEAKKAIVNEYYWDEEDKFYYDISESDLGFYKVRSIASYWALTAGVAPMERAEALVRLVFDKESFGGDIPFPSLARNDAEFEKDGRYWRGAVWLPTAYAALRGMAEYGYHREAQEAGRGLFEYMFKTYEMFEPHTIWECYAPEGFRPATRVSDESLVRPDFCGWSALGPIAVYIEFVLGFRSVNAFEKSVFWEKPDGFCGKIGIENLRFGSTVTDIIADGNHCTVRSNEPYTLYIKGRPFAILTGENTFEI